MLNEKKAGELTKKITDLGNIFKGRISGLSLYDVLDYVNHNEFELAFDILLDGLVEAGISVDSNEYHTLLELAVELGRDDTDLDIAYLKKHLLLK